MRTIIKFFGGILILLNLLFVISGCKKRGPAEALITVRNASGSPIQGALVELYQDTIKNPTNGVQASIHQQRTTDFSGQALFSFELEAVLNVQVSKDTLVVYDYIRLEQSKMVEKTIILQ